MSRGISIIRALKEKYSAQIAKTVQDMQEDLNEKKKAVREEFLKDVDAVVRALAGHPHIKITEIGMNRWGGHTIYIEYNIVGFENEEKKIEEFKQKMYAKLEQWEIEALKAIASKEEIPEFSF